MTTPRRRPDKCLTKFCRNPRAKKDGGFCSKCKKRQWRTANPVKAKLCILRDRAKRKKVPFDLTEEWLTEFLIKNKYNSLEHHIDRIKTWLGYTMDNLQVLPMSENIAKGNRERYGKLWMSAIVDEPF